MRGIEQGMNVPKQRRKIEQRITEAPDETHATYLRHLLELFDAAVANDVPQPASQFLPMYFEEFDIA